MATTEIKIPVPWGDIAAKIWGKTSDQMVIVVHGLMDNAGTFDRLIPLLPISFCYVCIDLPGHGKSTHFPPFVPIHLLNYIISLKLALQYFKQARYTILAHSFGGFVTFLFTVVYPSYVEKLIFFDILHTFPTSTDRFKNYLRLNIDYAISFEEKLKKNNKRPSYVYDEAFKRLKDQRLPTLVLTEEAVKPILERCIVPVEDGKYTFSTDARLKGFIGPISDFNYILEVFAKNPILCPVLSIVARGAKSQQRLRKPLKAFLETYENFSFVAVEGNHDVHNNNPEIVAPHVCEFLLKYKGKL